MDISNRVRELINFKKKSKLTLTSTLYFEILTKPIIIIILFFFYKCYVYFIL